MKLRNWTIVRFPAGSWSGGGAPNDPDYSECEVYLIPAAGMDGAKKKAQSIRSRLIKNGGELPSQTSPYTAS